MSPIPNWFERTSRKFDHASQMVPEANRVGTSGARIIRVNQQRIEYIDMTGQEQFIDLEECASNGYVGVTTIVKSSFPCQVLLKQTLMPRGRVASDCAGAPILCGGLSS